MKTYASLERLGRFDRLRKLHFANWTVPSFERLLPIYIALLCGFLAASLAGLFSAALLLPKPGASGSIPTPNESDPASGAGSPNVTLAAPPTESDFKWILARNLFNSEGGESDASKAPKEGQECVKTDLLLTLSGLIYGGARESSLVLLESTATKRADTFMLGDFVPGEAKITDIQRSRVVFDRSGRCEFLDLLEPELPKKRVARLRKPEDAARASLASLGGDSFREDGFERTADKIEATRQWVEKALTVDFAKTLQDAKASPHIVNGQVKGFVLTRIRPDSVYEKMGFKDGDVIEAINGIELNDAARAIQTLNSLRNENGIEVLVNRNGQSSNLKVSIK